MEEIQFKSQGYLEQHFQAIHSHMRAKINGNSDDYILNVDEEKYIEYLINEFTILPIELFRDKIFIDEKDEVVSSLGGAYTIRRAHEFGVQSQVKPLIIFYLPVVGDRRLLNFRPNTSLLSLPTVFWDVEGGNSYICVKEINHGQNPENIRENAERVFNQLEQQVSYINIDVESYNNNLPAIIRRDFLSKKTEIQRKNEVKAGIGFPLRKREGISETFAAPSLVKRKITIPQPLPTASPTSPDPVLNYDAYDQILKESNGYGKAIEKTPAIYAGKDEEGIRDLFLQHLQMLFEGEVTGETFNKQGHTDIIYKYKNQNLFVGECKIWSGESAIHPAINQLFGYLTWRDSKAAVLIFVKNKDFSSVIKKTESIVQTHPQFSEISSIEDEGTLIRTKFKFPEDSEKNVYITFLLFHFPE